MSAAPAARLVPACSLHALLAGAGVAMAAVQLVGRGVAPWRVAVTLVLVAAVVRFPASPAGAVLLFAVVAAQWASGDGTIGWRVVAMVPLVHAVHLLAAYAAAVPWRGDVDAAVLVRVARSFAVGQLLVAPVVLLAVVAQRTGGATIAPVLVLGAVAALSIAVLPWGMLRVPLR